MIELSTLQAVREVVTIVGVIAGLSYYIMTVRNQNKARQVQTFMALYNQFTDSSRMKEIQDLNNLEWDDYHDFETKYETGANRDLSSKRYAHWYSWDGLGHLYRKGLVDEDTIFSLNSAGGVTYAWAKWGSVIKEIRRRYNMPNLGVDMEYLSQEHKRMLVERGHDPEPPETLGRYIPEQ